MIKPWEDVDSQAQAKTAFTLTLDFALNKSSHLRKMEIWAVQLSCKKAGQRSLFKVPNQAQSTAPMGLLYAD